MKSLTLEFILALSAYALFLIGMFWLYKKFNQSIIAEACAQMERRKNIQASGE